LISRRWTAAGKQEDEMRRALRRLSLALGVLLASLVPAAAQDYPDRVVTIVVPFAAGGPADTLARQLAARFSERLGQTFVVENASGGGTTIGTARVARASADGYTLLLTNLAISSNVSLYPKLTFHPEKDLATIGFVNHSALVLVGRNSIPANSLPELATWMRGTRAKIAHTGSGSTAHLASAIFAKAAGVEIDHIPYRGGAPALQDVIAGHVDMFFGATQAHAEPVKSGAVKGFGITSRNRVEQLPQVPALAAELSPQLEIWFWHALFAPAGTPTPIISKLNGALRDLVEDPKIAGAWAAMGVQVYPKQEGMPEAGHALLVREIKRWGDVVRENQIEAGQP
jgi:tripartite-type tricarboxylate transporter receptor subunit TctC